MSQSTVDRVIRELTPALARLFDTDAQAHRDRRHLWVVDGTLIPTRDRTRNAISKNYRMSTNIFNGVLARVPTI